MHGYHVWYNDYNNEIVDINVQDCHKTKSELCTFVKKIIQKF